MKSTLQLLILAGLGCLLVLGCSTQDPDADAATEAARQEQAAALQAELDAARALYEAGELDEALLKTDAILAEHPHNREARLIAARGNAAMFSEGRQYAENFLADAVRNLERILDRDPADAEALLLLSWCRLKQGQFDAGERRALAAADAFRAQDADPEQVSTALVQAADNQLQKLADARRQEQEAGAEQPGDGATRLARDALATLQLAEAAAPNPYARRRTADVYLWMERPTDALESLEDGIRENPSATQLHQKLQQLYWDMDMRRECVAAYRRLLDETSASTAVQWYLGRAQVALGDDARRKSQWDAARRAYLDARETFQDYDEQRPGDHAATAEWLAICELSLGRVAYEGGDLEVAADHYRRAWEATEAVGEVDDNGIPLVRDSFGGNYLGGITMVGQSLTEQSDPEALRDALAFWRSVIERHPGRFGSLYNNAALTARDLGVAVWNRAREGDEDATPEEAMELWEQSYTWYEQAVPLAPDDPRIINDCGLMLVYYLNRDYARAEELFRRAIEVGQPQLDALPDDAPEAERRFLEEAVGDAHENMGKMLFENLGKPEAAKPWLQQALDYYPYQQRAARRMLRRIEEQQSGDTERAETFAALRERAQEAVEADDLDRALSILDEGAGELSEYAPYNALFGRLTLRFAEQKVAAGDTGNFVSSMFDDAVRSLSAAVELDAEPVEPRLALARAQLATGDAAAAATTADDLIGHTRAIGGADAETMTRIHQLRARGAARAYIARQSAGEDAGEDAGADATGDADALLRMARASFREVEGQAALTTDDLTLWTTMERWAGAPEQALAVAQRAAERDPAHIARFAELGRELDLNAAVRDALEDSEDATALWYRGRAGFDVAVEQWSSGETEQGITTLDQAIADFRRAIELNPDYEDSSTQWIALCRGQKGFLQLANDDLDGAEESFVQAATERPDVALSDLGGGSTIRRGLLMVGDRHYQAGDLEAACRLFAAAGEALPEDDQIANNHGLFARDYGNQLERNGQAEEAMAQYEASYAAYTRAQRLQPDDLRLRNDRALLLVYHLGRDYDVAEELLRSVIRDGEARLDNDPPSAADALQNLQEAVGDAYGNLGYHYMHNLERYADARPLLAKALDYYPHQQRAAARRLQRVEQLLKDGD